MEPMPQGDVFEDISSILPLGVCRVRSADPTLALFGYPIITAR
jgi:hypothetical protein